VTLPLAYDLVVACAQAAHARGVALLSEVFRLVLVSLDQLVLPEGGGDVAAPLQVR